MKVADRWEVPDADGWCRKCGYREHDGKCSKLPARCLRCDHVAVLPRDERDTVLAACACSCHDTPRFVYRVDLVQ